MIETSNTNEHTNNNINIPVDPVDDDTASGPFEGPEKLLEIWFEPAAPVVDVSETGDDLKKSGRVGLRTVDRVVWEEMLDIVKCKVLSVVYGDEMDAYLLSESSFFVFPHKLILKTCGTTLNLLGVPRILAIARAACGYNSVWRCFYSRKSFMFPERQHGPHREWRNEVEYLDALFDNGAAYTVGKVNGDHWLLYITSPPEEVEQDGEGETEQDQDQSAPTSDDEDSGRFPHPHYMTSSMASSMTLLPPSSLASGLDYTIELLMTKLAAPGRRPFLFLDEDLPVHEPGTEGPSPLVPAGDKPNDPSSQKGALVSQKLGIDSIFPSSRTRLDSYAFDPCGYSANALVNGGEENGGEGYYTIHVTPEEGWSYASFECNVPVAPATPGKAGEDVEQKNEKERMPDLETLIQRVVNIFQPGHISLTLFVSSSPSSGHTPSSTPPLDGKPSHPALDASQASVEVAQRVFRQALLPKGYVRSDKINYEFGGYDLAFATFQKRAVPHRR